MFRRKNRYLCSHINKHFVDMRSIDDRIKFEPSGFDYVNSEAKVVIVGITPGNNQLKGSREGI